MKLYSFFRSSSSYRTRIVLNLKAINYQAEYVSLAKNQHKSEAFKALNPQGFLPVLETAQGKLIQSPAIIEWLEENYPEPTLLPKDSFAKAQVRAMAAMIGCDIHPLNNKRVLEYLRQDLNQDESQIQAWCQRWITEGFDALENLLKQNQSSGNFCFGDSATIADAYLIPQVYSAYRFNVDLTAYPNIVKIYQHCLTLDAFKRASPEQQADAF